MQRRSNKIGDIRRSLRNTHGRYYQPVRVAERVGVSPTTLRRWEAGLMVPDLDNAIRLARDFGVSVEALGYDPAEAA